MSTLLIIQICVVLIGPFVGSFLAVLMDRLARGEDVVRAPSACRSCGVRLGVIDLVPVVSFAVKRGKCSVCKTTIPAWLLYSELMGAGAAILAVLAGQDVASVLLYALFLWTLIALAGADVLWLRLPDVLTAVLAAIAFSAAFLPDGVGLIQALWGAVIGAGSFAILRITYRYLRGAEGLGLGDVKLMIGLGAFAGPLQLPLLVLIAASCALAFAVLQRLQDTSALNPKRALPFGAALCASAAALWVLRVSALPLMN